MAKKGNPSKASMLPMTLRQEFHIDSDKVQYLNKIAENTDISKSEIVRRALALWISQNPVDEFIRKNSKLSR
jgi:predicted transcriptional regulator